jgi:hypothetical protein
MPSPEAATRPAQEKVPVMNSSIHPGRLWRSNLTGEDWMVTRSYSELFATYVVLRKVGTAEGETRRLKVERSAEGLSLPGFTLIQNSESEP